MGENKARAFDRRRFLKTTAAASLGTAASASLGTAVTGAWMAPAAAAEPAPIPPHGAELRGMDLVTQSPTAEGRFGFMFKNQPPLSASDALLDSLGEAMREQPVKGTQYIDPKTGQAVYKDGNPVLVGNNENDAFNENPNRALTSGFTFVGQFVDHDITFDMTPLGDQESDPYATSNFRSPRYDLDAIYGGGPNATPEFYDPSDRDKFLIEKRSYSTIGSDILKTPLTVYDVPRNADGTAKIADPRNDQTLIILQIHVAMQMFHNKLVDYMRRLMVPRAAVFESARRMARWHYQWMVIHEFLPAIVGKTMADSVYKETAGVPIINIKYYKPTNPLGRPFIPVEFSVAAYRFGHSITRPRYTVQEYLTSTGGKVKVSSVPLFDELTEANKNNILNGHRSLLLLPRLKLQWSKFFNKAGVITARPVRQFDASLSDALFVLPSTALPDANPMGLLSQRNLRRGRRMGLPSGQQVARLMGVTPLSNAELSKNHRIYVKAPIDEVTNLVEIVTPPGEFDEPNPSLEGVFKSTEWGGEAPLWFYILKEAEIAGDVGTGAGKGRWLGPVGGRIVAEVLVGLLQKDLNSYLYLQPGWKPAPPIAPKLGQFTMADLLTYAQGWY